jgi:hypothetical protein
MSTDRENGSDIVYKKNHMSTDRENGRGKKRARVSRGNRIPNRFDYTISSHKYYK